MQGVEGGRGLRLVAVEAAANRADVPRDALMNGRIFTLVVCSRACHGIAFPG
jgi:hypothetical protein